MRAGRPLGDDFPQVIDDAIFVKERVFSPVVSSKKNDFHAAMQKAGNLQALANRLGIEIGLGEDGRIGSEGDRGSRTTKSSFGLLQFGDRLALRELHFVLAAIAAHHRDQVLGERVDRRRSHAVQATRGLVVLPLELAPGMQDGQHHFQRALLGLGVRVDRNAATVVPHRDRPSIFVQRDRDFGGVAVHGFVDRVVDDFPDQVMQAGRADATDVHPGRLRTGSSPSRATMSSALYELAAVAIAVLLELLGKVRCRFDDGAAACY